jgi:NAD(P)-dependent dehydrogenase (short-subunit alcohol dehydrogenase family)
MGKIVIKMRPTDMVKTKPQCNYPCKIDADASYLVVGDLRGLRRSVARWMVARGAKNLVLLSRNGPQSIELIELIEELRRDGIFVEAPACGISDIGSLLDTLDHCAKQMPPI